MESAGISIISPTTLTDVAAATMSRKTGSGMITSITLPTGNKIHTEKEPSKDKANWLQSLLQNDATLWETMVMGLAELVGTAILVFLGCAGCIGGLSSAPPHLQISLAFGFAVMVAIQIIGHISGAHINPAVTVSSVILGHKSLVAAGVYFIAQCLGAIIGYGLLKVVTPSDLQHTGDPTTLGSFCVTAPNSKLTPLQGLLSETFATCMLILLCCGIWDPRNAKNTDSNPIKFGLTVAVLAMVVGPYTGCSMNPARSLGPAVWNNSWNSHWIYWVGPIAGSILGTLAYKALFWPKKSRATVIDEAVALNKVETEKSEQM